MNLSADTIQEIDQIIPKYPEKRSAALMVIHLIQDEIGAIDLEACEWIAQKLEVQPINIQELITFYPMLREKPWGKKHLRVCRTLPCALRGSYATCQSLEKKLGVKEGHVSDNGEYSLEFMECLADCGEGPVVMVDEQTYENVDAEKAVLLADLLLKGKLDSSKKFVSYEQALVSESKTKASVKSKSSKK
ncbi:MAG: NAD(P)H-dependent oxidoreductase subunit E [Puniceicoccaceae bacterium]|nr:NAD(P)H-dependent oxidoreductase subunit E [Puniceicoccaceae bacterium]|tara:strand:- start:14722 stop:15291 length:570 start_codon:yes stop_codon:yes gene_type:complete